MLKHAKDLPFHPNDNSINSKSNLTSTSHIINDINSIKKIESVINDISEIVDKSTLIYNIKNGQKKINYGNIIEENYNELIKNIDNIKKIFFLYLMNVKNLLNL